MHRCSCTGRGLIATPIVYYDHLSRSLIDQGQRSFFLFSGLSSSSSSAARLPHVVVVPAVDRAEVRARVRVQRVRQVARRHEHLVASQARTLPFRHHHIHWAPSKLETYFTFTSSNELTIFTL